MILGTSHFALATDDVAASVRFLETLGYTARFEESELQNHPSKKTWLRTYHPTHHILMMKKSGFQSVELLQHDLEDRAGAPEKEWQPAGRCIPVFRLGANTEWFQFVDPDEAFSESPTNPNLLAFDAQTLHELGLLFGAELRIVRAGPDRVLGLALVQPDEDVGIISVVVAVEDAPAYKRFLTKLRFRAEKSASEFGDEPQRFRHISPFPELNSDLTVVARKHFMNDRPIRLDQPGINCIALACRGADKDLAGEGIEVCKTTGPFTLNVNNKELSITLTEFSDGPIMEFLTL